MDQQRRTEGVCGFVHRLNAIVVILISFIVREMCFLFNLPCLVIVVPLEKAKFPIPNSGVQILTYLEKVVITSNVVFLIPMLKTYNDHDIITI